MAAIYEAGGEQHRYSIDDDRCRCGGCWVYFEDELTHGCEAAGPPPGDLVLDGYGRVPADRAEVLAERAERASYAAHLSDLYGD